MNFIYIKMHGTTIKKTSLVYQNPQSATGFGCGKPYWGCIKNI